MAMVAYLAAMTEVQHLRKPLWYLTVSNDHGRLLAAITEVEHLGKQPWYSMAA